MDAETGECVAWTPSKLKAQRMLLCPTNTRHYMVKSPKPIDGVVPGVKARKPKRSKRSKRKV